MSIRDNLEKVINILEKMKNYDAEGFSSQLLYMTRELDFFYSKLVEKQNDKNPSKTFYNVRPISKRPNQGQVGYFSLRRGYPKEVYDGHYCYVLKDFGVKFVVIPLTSVKDGSTANPNFEMDIEIKDFINNNVSRLQITDIRAVDVQRIDESREVYDVNTPRQLILDKVQNLILT